MMNRRMLNQPGGPSERTFTRNIRLQLLLAKGLALLLSTPCRGHCLISEGHVAVNGRIVTRSWDVR